jgi:hypothetical protein
MAEYGFMNDVLHVKKLESPTTTTIVIGMSFLIYLLAGVGLIYWTKRQTKLSQATPESR